MMKKQSSSGCDEVNVVIPNNNDHQDTKGECNNRTIIPVPNNNVVTDDRLYNNNNNITFSVDTEEQYTSYNSNYENNLSINSTENNPKKRRKSDPYGRLAYTNNIKKDTSKRLSLGNDRNHQSSKSTQQDQQQQQPDQPQQQTKQQLDDERTVKTGRGSLVGWTTCPLCGDYSKKRYALGRGIAAHLHAVHTPWNPSKVQQKIHQRNYERQQWIQYTTTSIAKQQQQEENENDSFNETELDPNNRIITQEESNNTTGTIIRLGKRKRKRSNNGEVENSKFVPLRSWTPTTEEQDAWDDEIATIVKELEIKAVTAVSEVVPSTRVVSLGDTCKNYKDNVTNAIITNTNDNQPERRVDTVEVIQSGYQRDGCTVSRSYRESLPPFLQAAADGDLEQLQKMVHEQEQSRNSTKDNAKDQSIRSNVQNLLQTTDRHLSTAEHWAAGGGHLDCLKYLLELQEKFGINKTTTTNENIDTKAVDDLSSSKAIVETNNTSKVKKVRRRDGKTCLHYAARNGKLDCIRYLIEEKGWDVNECSGDGTTPLQLAGYGGQYDTIRYLIEVSKANVHHTNEWGCSVAHFVAMSNTTPATEINKICNYLLQTHQVNFVHVQNQGHTPLHKAAQRLNRNYIEWMMNICRENGMSIEQQRIAGQSDHGGHTPSSIWTSCGGAVEFGNRMKNEFDW